MIASRPFGGNLLLVLLLAAILASPIPTAAGAPDVPAATQIITFRIALIRATAGDMAKSGIAFDYQPFAPAVTGTMPTNAETPLTDEGSLAYAHEGDGPALLKYLSDNGKTVARFTMTTFSGVPASVSATKRIRGAYGGGFSGAITFTDRLETKIGVTPTIDGAGNLSYALSVALTGGRSVSGMTIIYQETIKAQVKQASQDIFAFGGIASPSVAAPRGVPLITPGLPPDKGFGGVDPKTPALFVFVTASEEPGSAGHT